MGLIPTLGGRGFDSVIRSPEKDDTRNSNYWLR